jgi:hypothetical protein
LVPFNRTTVRDGGRDSGSLKKLVLLSGGHVPDSPIEIVREALNWFDRYLGPVN